MTTLRIKDWTFDIVAPLRVRRVNHDSSAQDKATVSTRIFDQPLYRDPTPTPGAFEPPVDLFRVIARGERGLE